MKILVFDPDKSLRELLRIYLTRQGHEVMAFRDPVFCPLYGKLHDEGCCCPQASPCADVVIVDNRMPHVSAIDFFRLQRQRGCKALDANKAVMSASMSQQLEEMVAEFGCHYIKKPFKLSRIKSWLDSCLARLPKN